MICLFFVVGFVLLFVFVFVNSYLIEVIVDYVIGCMVVNGQIQDGLCCCVCSIDVIVFVLLFEKYEQVDMVLWM